MVRPDEFVKVLDFGLAKLAPATLETAGGDRTHTVLKTEAGTVVGTAAYMSPEQARGQEVDTRTDTWSLGVVLCEMLAGRSPFAAPSGSEVLAAILDREPMPLARFAPDTPAELQRLLTKCLRKERTLRYQTVQDLLLDLQTLRDDLSAQTRAASAPIAVTPPALDPLAAKGTAVAARPRRIRVLAALAAILVGTTALGIWWWRTKGRTETPASVAPVHRNLTRLTFGPGLQTDVTWSPDGARIAYAADRKGNFDIWSQAIEGGDPVQITNSPAADTQPAWSPDGRFLVFRSERDGGGLFLVPALGGPARQLSSFGVHPEWSRDGAEITFQVGAADEVPTNVYRVSPDAGEPPRELFREFLQGGLWDWVAFHPDGRLSALGLHRQRGYGFFTASRHDGQVTTSSVAPGLPLAGREMGTRVRRFRWNSTGDALILEALVNQVRNVWKVRVEPNSLRWVSAERLTTGTGADVAPALASDGRRIVFTTQRESLRLWVFPFDPLAGRVTGDGHPVSPEEGEVTPSDLSPDGRTIAFGLRRAGSDRADLWLTDIDTGASELLAENAFGPCWSPDGRTLAYNLFRPDRPPPGEWALAIRQRGGAERVLGRWSTQGVLMPSDWTRNSRSLLGSYLAPLYTGIARLEVWPIDGEAATAPERVVVQDARAKIWQGRYSPDGRWISFVAQPTDDSTRAQMNVAPASGGNRAEWTRIAEEHEWADKPRWSSDGRTIYFLSRHGTSYWNLWGNRFDASRGKPLGKPFRVTRFDTPGLIISRDISQSEIGVSARRVILTMAAITGNIWMLDNVDK